MSQRQRPWPLLPAVAPSIVAPLIAWRLEVRLHGPGEVCWRCWNDAMVHVGEDAAASAAVHVSWDEAHSKGPRSALDSMDARSPATSASKMRASCRTRRHQASVDAAADDARERPPLPHTPAASAAPRDSPQPVLQRPPHALEAVLHRSSDWPPIRRGSARTVRGSWHSVEASRTQGERRASS